MTSCPLKPSNCLLEFIERCDMVIKLSIGVSEYFI